MASLRELEEAVEALPDREYGQFREWFMERDWNKWDRQIESDSASGNLDFLLQEVRDAKMSKNLRNL